jgi:hypothetical protein
VIFHLTISHSPQDCPGRRPADPPELIAPSDTRDTLGRELGVKLHLVLWGASCMLWAQPEHLAFAVLEADDVESLMQYVGALVPSGWTCSALPVWNLPSQLRLIQQVRQVPLGNLGGALGSAERGGQPRPSASTVTPKAEARAASRVVASPTDPTSGADRGSGTDRVLVQATGGLDSPGTITRMLHELDASQEDASDPPKSKTEHAPVNPKPASTEIIEHRERELTPTTCVSLVATAGPARGRTYIVAEESATIGRLLENPVSIPDDRLSREHARIEFHDGDYWLCDLRSTNGTALNGTLLSNPQLLHNGDRIELGATLLRVTIEPSAAPTGT